jgi:hypothetical protein
MVLILLSAGCGYDDSYTGAGGGTGTGAAGGGTATDFDAGACVDTWADFGATFFTDTCGGCHGSYGSHSGVKSAASSLASVISSGSMPRGGGLSSTVRARAVLYLRCGAP